MGDAEAAQGWDSVSAKPGTADRRPNGFRVLATCPKRTIPTPTHKPQYTNPSKPTHEPLTCLRTNTRLHRPLNAPKLQSRNHRAGIARIWKGDKGHPVSCARQSSAWPIPEDWQFQIV